MATSYSHYDNEKHRVRFVALGVVSLLAVLVVVFILFDYFGSRSEPFDLVRFASEECVRKGGVPEVTGHYGTDADIHCKFPGEKTY